MQETQASHTSSLQSIQEQLGQLLRQCGEQSGSLPPASSTANPAETRRLQRQAQIELLDGMRQRLIDQAEHEVPTPAAASPGTGASVAVPAPALAATVALPAAKAETKPKARAKGTAMSKAKTKPAKSSEELAEIQAVKELERLEKAAARAQAKQRAKMAKDAAALEAAQKQVEEARLKARAATATSVNSDGVPRENGETYQPEEHEAVEEDDSQLRD